MESGNRYRARNCASRRNTGRGDLGGGAVRLRKLLSHLRPAAGGGVALFRDADDVKGAPITAVMSYALWQSRYGGEPSIIGSTFFVDTSR